MNNNYSIEVRAAILGLPLDSKSVRLLSADDVSKKWGRLSSIGLCIRSLTELSNLDNMSKEDYQAIMVSLDHQWLD